MEKKDHGDIIWTLHAWDEGETCIKRENGKKIDFHVCAKEVSRN